MTCIERVVGGTEGMHQLFSEEEIRKTYEELLWHKRSRDIILEYALNRSDVREEALRGLDLGGAREVIDLGCGYGFFTEALGGRLHRKARVIGVDVVNHRNREAFVDTVTCMGYEAAFIQGSADIVADLETARFDLAIASYSLYFFPHLVPEISRILKDTGVFIAVTHSETSLGEIISHVVRSMEEHGIAPAGDLRINKLFKAFSVEGGRQLLEPHFHQVECIPFANALAFPLDRFEACIDYLDTKKHLLLKEVADHRPEALEAVMDALVRNLFDHARSHGKVVVSKDDGIFRCRRPVRRGP